MYESLLSVQGILYLEPSLVVPQKFLPALWTAANKNVDALMI
jgi:hypothetical protein